MTGEALYWVETVESPEGDFTVIGLFADREAGEEDMKSTASSALMHDLWDDQPELWDDNVTRHPGATVWRYEGDGDGDVVVSLVAMKVQ
jgi:hypothetical protein